MTRHHSVTWRARILGQLASGNITTGQLADLFGDSSGRMARAMAQLRNDGVVKRVDGGSGRGSVAVWALVEKGS